MVATLTALAPGLIFAAGGHIGTTGVTILTRHFPLQFAASNLLSGVRGVTLHCLARAGDACCPVPHLSPGDLRLMGSANIWIAAGPVDAETRRQLPADCRILDVLAAVPVSPGGDGAVVNPHVWMSPLRFAACIDVLALELGGLLPEHAEAIRAQGHALGQDLTVLAGQMRDGLTTVQGTAVLVDHDSMAQLAEDLGLRVAAVIRPGEVTPQPAELAELVTTARKDGVKLILASNAQGGGRLAAIVAEESGAVVCRLPEFTSGPVTQKGYVEAMQGALNALQSALGVPAGRLGN